MFFLLSFSISVPLLPFLPVYFFPLFCPSFHTSLLFFHDEGFFLSYFLFLFLLSSTLLLSFPLSVYLFYSFLLLRGLFFPSVSHFPFISTSLSLPFTLLLSFLLYVHLCYTFPLVYLYSFFRFPYCIFLLFSSLLYSCFISLTFYFSVMSHFKLPIPSISHPRPFSVSPCLRPSTQALPSLCHTSHPYLILCLSGKPNNLPSPSLSAHLLVALPQRLPSHHTLAPSSHVLSEPPSLLSPRGCGCCCRE